MDSFQINSSDIEIDVENDDYNITNNNDKFSKNNKFDLNKNLAIIVENNVKKIKKDDAKNPSNNKNSVNYRLIHHLYLHHRSSLSSEKDQLIWKMIANDYNSVLSTNFSATDIKKFWNRMPLMEKRTINLQHHENIYDTEMNDENVEPEKIKADKTKKSTKNDSDKKKKISKNKKLSNKKDKECQTMFESGIISLNQDPELIKLTKEKYRLKIELLKMRLDYLRRHFW